MLKRKRFSPKLKLKADSDSTSNQFFTVIRLEHISDIVSEYENQVKDLVKNKNTMIKLAVEALTLYYCWNKDFLDVGLKDLPADEDLDTIQEKQTLEILIDFIIKAMHRIDSYHPEFRTLCTNVSSVNTITIYGTMVLLSISVTSESVH